MNRPIIWESPYLTYGYDHYPNSIYNSLKQKLSINDQKYVNCENTIYSNSTNDAYLFLQHMPKTNSKYISDELHSSKNEISSVMDGYVPIEHNLKHSEIGPPVVGTGDDSQKANDGYGGQCDKYEVGEEKRDRLLTDSHVDGDRYEVSDVINTSYGIHDTKDSAQNYVPAPCVQSLDDEKDVKTPHNTVDLEYVPKQQINENCNIYDNKTCTTSSNTSVYTGNDAKETSSIDFNKQLYTDPHNYTTYMQSTLYDNWPSVNNIDAQFNSTIATPIWENGWVGREYQTDYMHSNLVKDNPTQLHDRSKTAPYISPEMYLNDHTYGIPYICERTRNYGFLDNYSPSKDYKKPYFGLEGIASVNSNNCSPLDMLEKNGYGTNFNLYGPPNQFQRVPTIKTDFTYYDNSKDVNNYEDILGAVYKGCTDGIDTTNIDFIGMDDKVWQALRGAGMFKLGNKGRAILKSKISKHLKMHPEVRLRASCISGVRRATTRQLFQLAQLMTCTDKMKTGVGESQNVCFKSDLSKILASSTNDRQRLDNLHNRILGLEVSEQNGKGIRVIRQRESLVKSILEDSPINETVESFLNSSLPKRAAPSIPSDIRDKLYGTPGNNIFTYDIDKPKPHKSAPVHLEDGMIPTDDSTNEWYHIRRLHTLLKDSLDQSFLPKETGGPRISKKILNTAHISQLEDGLISKEDVGIYGEFVNPETRGNMGANLVPLTNGRVSRRKQFKFQPQDFERSRDASETDSQSTAMDDDILL